MANTYKCYCREKLADWLMNRFWFIQDRHDCSNSKYVAIVFDTIYFLSLVKIDEEHPYNISPSIKTVNFFTLLKILKEKEAIYLKDYIYGSVY